MSSHGDFLLQQKVWDAFSDVGEHLRRHATVVAVHPDDLTDELRARIVALPLTTLRESRHIKRGMLMVLHPGLLDDLTAPQVLP